MGRGQGTILCLVGPTAVGKTALIAALSARLPVEVLSLDSRQIYRGLPIGTAQPTAQELEICPHHLCGFLPIDQTYDAASYRRDFQAAHEEIARRGAVPVAVGGAGMYLTAVREGFLEVPPEARDRLPAVRAAIEALAPAMVRRRLGDVDPESAARVHPNDLYRARRALEIFELTGRSMTELTKDQRPDPVRGLDFRVVVLQRPVAELDRRIAARTQVMLQEGWIAETAAALDRYGPDAPGLQSIGYPQVVEHLQGKWGLEEAMAAIVRRTRQYAKRQRTWFRKVDAVRRAHPDDPDLVPFLAGLLES